MKLCKAARMSEDQSTVIVRLLDHSSIFIIHPMSCKLLRTPGALRASPTPCVSMSHAPSPVLGGPGRWDRGLWRRTTQIRGQIFERHGVTPGPRWPKKMRPGYDKDHEVLIGFGSKMRPQKSSYKIITMKIMKINWLILMVYWIHPAVGYSDPRMVSYSWQSSWRSPQPRPILEKHEAEARRDDWLEARLSGNFLQFTSWKITMLYHV